MAYAQGFYDVAALPDGSLVAYGWFLGHDRVVYFDRNGRVTREVSDQVREQLRQTVLEGHLAADGTGRAWLLTGYAEPSILGFAPDGKFTDRIPAGKAREQQFTGSASIAADNAGRLLVTGRDAVQVWTTGGQFLQSLPVEGVPRDIAVVDATTAWVSTGAQKILKIRLPAPTRTRPASARRARFRRVRRPGRPRPMGISPPGGRAAAATGVASS